MWKCSVRRRAHDFTCLSSLKFLWILLNNVAFTLSQALEIVLADLTTNLSVYFLYLLCEPLQRELRYNIYLWKSITKAPLLCGSQITRKCSAKITASVWILFCRFYFCPVSMQEGELASFQETNERNSLKRLLKDLSGQNWIEPNRLNWTEQTSIMIWIMLCNGAHHCIVSVVLLLSHAQSVHNFPVDQNFKTKMWELFDLLYSFQMIRTYTSTLFLTQLHTFIPV